MKRAALYLRVSTEDQTTDNQRLILEQAATARGWTVVATFADAAVSGTKPFAERPAASKLLASLADFDVVMLWAIDRLGRNTRDLLQTIDLLHSHKTRLYFHQQQIDTTTPSGRMFFTIMSATAEYEREHLVQRTKAGLERTREAGTRLGSPQQLPDAKLAHARKLLRAGSGIRPTATATGISVSHVARLAKSIRIDTAPD